MNVPFPKALAAIIATAFLALAPVPAHALPADATTPRYLVVDVSAGPDAASYAVGGLDEVPAGGWTDEYKTSKIVLQLVESGTFTQSFARVRAGLRQIVVSRPFYLGVFEVTQRQWELVKGPWGFAFTNAACAATRPADTIGYSHIRGKHLGLAWPYSRIVDTDSFIGRLRSRTGMMGFDLPTGAQWELACTAGGRDTGGDTADMGRFRPEGQTKPPQPFRGSPSRVGADEGTAPVGSYRPNAWGFYDMLGNIAEWVRDHYVNSEAALEGVLVDPKGPASPPDDLLCAIRGGDYRTARVFCVPAFICGRGVGDEHGFRLCCELPPDIFTPAPQALPPE